jgi:hypothetical protein
MEIQWDFIKFLLFVKNINLLQLILINVKYHFSHVLFNILTVIYCHFLLRAFTMEELIFFLCKIVPKNSIYLI